MNAPTYPASEVDPLIADLLEDVSAAIALADEYQKRAAEAEKKVAEASNKVVLEKVASSPEVLKQTLDTLVKRAFIVETDREILEEQLQEPDNVLRLLEKIAKLSPLDEHNAGRGIPKSASTQTDSGPDQDGWHRVWEDQNM